MKLIFSYNEIIRKVVCHLSLETLKSQDQAPLDFPKSQMDYHIKTVIQAIAILCALVKKKTFRVKREVCC